MVSKKRSKKLPYYSSDCKTRQEWDNWYDEYVYPGFSKKIHYMIYAKDPKTHMWIEPGSFNFRSTDTFGSKRDQLSARKIPPYDTLDDFDKDYVGKHYHIFSERDRQKFNRSMVAIPTSISQEWVVRQAAKKQQKELSFPDPWYAQREFPRMNFEKLRSAEYRRNRSKHPLLRR